jgi:hypothetical protein
MRSASALSDIVKRKHIRSNRMKEKLEAAADEARALRAG